VEEFNSKGEFVRAFGSVGSGNGQFSSPKGVAIDSEGDVWVADTSNNRLERFSSEGTYVSQTGTVGNNSGQFYQPEGVATDTSGNVWVADTDNNRIQEGQPQPSATTTYGYDQAGDLTSIERPEGESKPKIEDSYAYNGEGFRTSQTISGTTSYLAWDMTTGLPLILSDGTNSYIYGPGELPIEQINNSTGTVEYLHHDQQGSTRLLTGSTGTVEATMTYDAYGNKTGSTGTATTSMGYDGQYTSSDTGLIYLRQRVYDPATAQFLSVDPLEKLTLAPYNYVEDNPVNAVDPTGLCGTGSVSEFADCFNPVSSGNIAYQGATELSNATGGAVDLPWLLTRPAAVDIIAAGVCATPWLDAGCPAALGAAWSDSTSSVVVNGIETNFCDPSQLAAEEAVTTSLFGFGALGIYGTGAADAANAPGYARAIIRGGPAALEGFLNGPLAAHGG
jgi:RHS repeat-associated protein